MAGKVRIFTGTGHGKTSAALGLALQRADQGAQVIIIQFLKAKDLSESSLMKRLEPEIRLFRFERSDGAYDSMTPEEKQEETENIRNGLNFARKVLDTAECDLLVMDEVLGLIDNGIITYDDLQNLMDRRGDTDIILTGVSMDDRICRFADEISEIRTVNFMNFDTQK